MRSYGIYLSLSDIPLNIIPPRSIHVVTNGNFLCFLISEYYDSILEMISQNQKQAKYKDIHNLMCVYVCVVNDKDREMINHNSRIVFCLGEGYKLEEIDHRKVQRKLRGIKKY